MPYVNFNRQTPNEKAKTLDGVSPDTLYFTKLDPDSNTGSLWMGGVEYGIDYKMIEEETIDKWFPYIVVEEEEIAKGVRVNDVETGVKYDLLAGEGVDTFILKGSSDTDVPDLQTGGKAAFKADFSLKANGQMFCLKAHDNCYLKKIDLVMDSNQGEKLVIGTKVELQDDQPYTVIADSKLEVVLTSPYIKEGDKSAKALLTIKVPNHSTKEVYIQNFTENSKKMKVGYITATYIKEKDIKPGLNLEVE